MLNGYFIKNQQQNGYINQIVHESYLRQEKHVERKFDASQSFTLIEGAL